jgi:hypothetical protein
MNAVAMIEGSGIPSREPEVCRVAVLCEDAVTREKAVEVCEHLAAQFEDEMLFAISYWKLAELTGAPSARRAADAAADADIIVFFTHGDDLTHPARNWFDLCAAQRRKREGALGVLLVEPLSPTASVGVLLSRLEYVAARLHVDFLPLLPSSNGSLDGVDERATAITSLLKEILDPPQAPSHWGLNE